MKKAKTAKVKTAKVSRKAVAEKATKRGPSVFVIGDGKAGHTLISASQLGEQLGIDPKRVRAWLRGANGVGNDGKYTRYLLDIDSKDGRLLVKRAVANFS